MADEPKRGARVVALPASDFYKADQALAHAAGLDLQDVLIVGRFKEGGVTIVNSRLTQGELLLLAKEAELFALGISVLCDG
ncbi:hypothetical protein [Dongia deserti]|uniref:hypothetical protein n=1 Tax=Dongia deserti TaxID=2268030 RepID=UPI000E6560DA|nr:hypothetical protein [Dongia deserti]